MKKILSYAIASIASVMLIGCAACKDWFNSVDWNNVNNVVIPVVQVTAQNTSFLVCDKNPDLKPIFITAGNGILLAVLMSNLMLNKSNYISSKHLEMMQINITQSFL